MGTICHDDREAQEKQSEEQKRTNKRRRIEEMVMKGNGYDGRTQHALATNTAQQIQRVGENFARRIANKQQGRLEKGDREKTIDRLRCGRLFFSIYWWEWCESRVHEHVRKRTSTIVLGCVCSQPRTVVLFVLFFCFLCPSMSVMLCNVGSDE